MAKKLIGDPINRIDGKEKVTGTARYSADIKGADRVRVTYDTEPLKPELPANLDKAVRPSRLPRGDDQIDTLRGDMKAGMDQAATHFEATYRTPTQIHNALEPHALVSYWEGDK